VLPIGPWRFRFRRRAALAHLAVLAAIVLLALVALTLGDYGLDLGQVVQALTGRSADPLAVYFVQDVRAPRVLGALLVGAALGTSGALFQTLTGNELGSPDVIGFSTGAASGALLQIIVVGGGPLAVAGGAVTGGLLSAGVVYALAWRRGVAGSRLVLVGIGISATLAAVNQLLVVRASLTAAQTAAQWLAGSLNAVLWPQVGLLAAALVVLLPASWLLARPLGMLPLGDPLAVGVGVRVERTRLLAIVVGVALVAVATATAGPVAFVALAAPHVARRLAGTPGVPTVGAGLTGALLVLAADVVAQRVLAPHQLAVGVVTGALGGIYLIVLLASRWRRSR
jgi:iron complex transport system permease protein